MRVSLVTSVPLVPPWDQGDKNLAYALTAALPEHHFEVLTARGQPAPPGDNLERRPLFGSRNPSLLDKLRIYAWFLSRPLARRAGRDPGPSPDLYHFVYQPYPLSSWFSRQLPEFRRRPSLHTIPATASRWTGNPRLFFADRLVAISRHGQRRLKELGLRNVTYIPPGIDPLPWQSLAGQSEHFKAELGLAGHPVALFPGHYGPGQGSGVMLRALPLLAAECPRLRVLFACRIRSEAERAREAEVRQALEGMGLAGLVHTHNTVRDMRPLIGASDVVLLPLESMRDKLDIPTTLLEFLAAGKPIVISDLAPMRELVEDPEGRPSPEPGVGLLVPPGDAGALARAAAALLADRNLREGMGRCGQALVREQFGIQRVAGQYESLYQEMTT
jgi:glycosyltransferase involved in cell wall biosynthesis